MSTKDLKREAKRMVKRTSWDHEPNGRAIKVMAPFVAFAAGNPATGDCGWMLSVQMANAATPNIVEELKPIAGAKSYNTLSAAKTECDEALVKVVFHELKKGMMNAQRTATNSGERRGESGQTGGTVHEGDEHRSEGGGILDPFAEGKVLGKQQHLPEGEPAVGDDTVDEETPH